MGKSETEKTIEDVMPGAPAALATLATETHAFIEQSVRMVDADPSFEADVLRATEELAAIRARLERHSRGPALDLGRPDDPPDGRPYYVSGVLGGSHHPMTMPVELATTDGVTTGRVCLDVAWEGPPGCVHGGYVAHLFDCILGQHNLNVGVPGMTGTLSVRYRQPTPLLTELRFEVRTHARVRRKITTTAELRAGDTICAEAEGIFIVPETAPGGALGWPDGTD